jgi:acetolactate synthase-1/2/3 large subunit
LKTIELIAQILKKEGVEYLPGFPTTPMIEAAAAVGIRPIICRQERVGVGIADGISRASDGEKTGVFAMQFGPGAENAFSGVATAYSDSTPMLLLPLGHSRSRQGVFPHFSSMTSYAAVTKSIEQINITKRTSEIMRRAFAALRQGRGGPALVEIPFDLAGEEVDGTSEYTAVKRTASQGDPRDVEAAAQALCAAKCPVIHAGQGVLYARASAELVELAELIQAPVMTTLLGKSAFPETHPLSLGNGSGVAPGPLVHFLEKADVIFGIGSSLTKHPMTRNLPENRKFVHATNDTRDLNKDYVAEYPIVGDAKLVLKQLIEACRDIVGDKRRKDGTRAKEIQAQYETWLAKWMPKLRSDTRPINPYRVIWDFMQAIPATDAIVTHDSGSPRSQIVPFYRCAGPRSYIGWGKSHGLGTGLGLIMGAKLVHPDKVCVNFMGDAAFGMVGLDFETAVRHKIPIITVVLNNNTMACETHAMAVSHKLYQTRDLGGNYADLARAMGGHAERIEDPSQVVAAFQRARRLTEQEGKTVLLEFITPDETEISNHQKVT